MLPQRGLVDSSAGNRAALALGMLAEAMATVSGAESLSTFWETACQAPRHTLTSTFTFAVLNYGVDRLEVVGQHSRRLTTNLVGTLLPKGDDGLSGALTQRSPTVISLPKRRLVGDDPLRTAIRDSSAHTVVVSPLRSGQSPFGALIMTCGDLDADERTILISVGGVYAAHVAGLYRHVRELDRRAF